MDLGHGHGDIAIGTIPIFDSTSVFIDLQFNFNAPKPCVAQASLVPRPLPIRKGAGPGDKARHMLAFSINYIAIHAASRQGAGVWCNIILVNWCELPKRNYINGFPEFSSTGA